MNNDNVTLTGEEITECLQEVCETFSDPQTFDKMSFCEKAIVENVFLKLEKVFNQKINSKRHKI